jgi:hypothetical protein
MTPYQPRPIRFLELWQVDDWRLKVYGIAHGRPEPRTELIGAAKAIATQRLRSLPEGSGHYHVGFLGVHDGRTSNFVFLDYWADEDELHHHVFVTPDIQVQQFSYATPTGLSACVWDLRLQSFERDAWVTHILKRSAAPDFEGYLGATLSGDF